MVDLFLKLTLLYIHREAFSHFYAINFCGAFVSTYGDLWPLVVFKYIACVRNICMGYFSLRSLIISAINFHPQLHECLHDLTV